MGPVSALLRRDVLGLPEEPVIRIQGKVQTEGERLIGDAEVERARLHICFCANQMSDAGFQENEVASPVDD